MAIKNIPLDQLHISAANVRKTGTKDGIVELAHNIRIHSLLQNLNVIEEGKGFAVIAGGRRLAALQLLAKEKHIAADWPVPCNVVESENAEEISLTENELRQAMHPADQFAAFKKLHDAGEGDDTIAAKYGVSPAVVRQRLKMATISPKLLAAFRAGEMKLEHVMALTLTDDHKRQEKVWKGIPAYMRDSAHDGADYIRDELTEELIDAEQDRKAKFVGIASYEEAGGRMVRDLFDTEGKGFIADHELLNRLAAEKLEKKAEQLRKDGWKWVEIRTSTESTNFGRLKNDWGDAKYTKSDMEKSGVVISIGYDGKVDQKRGCLKADDMKEIKKATKSKAKVDKEPKGRDPGALSAQLLENLTSHHTAALQAKLSVNPRLALVAIVHRLTTDIFFDGACSSSVQITPRELFFDDKELESSRAGREIVAARKTVSQGLPKDEEKLWDWLLKQDQKRLLEILAVCVACTVDAVEKRRSSFDGDHSPENADQLAAALKLDMAEYWQPTAANYFDRVSAAQIIAAVTEGGSKADATEIRSKNGAIKKAELSKLAESLLKGKGWVPKIMGGQQ